MDEKQSYMLSKMDIRLSPKCQTDVKVKPAAIKREKKQAKFTVNVFTFFPNMILMCLAV